MDKKIKKPTVGIIKDANIAEDIFMTIDADSELVPLFAVYKKNGKIHIDYSPDSNEYEIYGILRSYVDLLELELAESWTNK